MACIIDLPDDMVVNEIHMSATGEATLGFSLVYYLSTVCNTFTAQISTTSQVTHASKIGKKTSCEITKKKEEEEKLCSLCKKKEEKNRYICLDFFSFFSVDYSNLKDSQSSWLICNPMYMIVN